jgi:Mrp family chromosome partitioning ATPase
MKQPAPLYVITSPRPRMGKTLLARLMMEYFQQSGRPLVGFDLNPREPMLAGRFPKLVCPWISPISAARWSCSIG